MTEDDVALDKWFARRWMGIVLFSFLAGVMVTLVVVLLVVLAHAAL